MQWIQTLFGTQKPIVAMCHLRALPGDPCYAADRGMAWVIDQARQEIAATQGQSEVATQLLGAATGLRNAIICHLPPVERPAHERTVATLRASLGETTFTAAWAMGQAMPLEQTLELALAIPLGR